jgi:hypothetical protein
MSDLLSIHYDRPNNWQSTTYNTPIPQAAFKYLKILHKLSSWHQKPQISEAVLSFCKWGMLTAPRLMQIPQLTLNTAQE